MTFVNHMYSTKVIERRNRCSVMLLWTVKLRVGLAGRHAEHGCLAYQVVLRGADDLHLGEAFLGSALSVGARRSSHARLGQPLDRRHVADKTPLHGPAPSLHGNLDRVALNRGGSVTQLDPSKTALVLIDLQRGIIAFPAEPRATAEVIANAVRLADSFRAAGAAVVLVHVAIGPDGGDRLRAQVDEPRPMRQRPTDFAEIVAELGPKEGDIVVTKRQWGAFYGTGLDLQLR
jgi:Isochorismatase family